jgi:hypothetical protein
MSELDNCPQCKSEIPSYLEKGRVICIRCGWSDQPKLYTGFVATLKLLQVLGYFIAVVFSLSQTYQSSGGIFLGIILSLTSCFVIYISTQGLTAVIDLLSRIERNTR